MAARLQEKYASEVCAKLQEEFNYSNPMQMPRLTKVVVNMGLEGDVAINKNTKRADSTRRTRRHHWSEGGRDPSAAFDRRLQAARGDADRCLRDAARAQHVGILWIACATWRSPCA